MLLALICYPKLGSTVWNGLSEIDGYCGTFHELAKVVNRLFGETWPIAEFGLTNDQLEFERCRYCLLQIGRICPSRCASRGGLHPIGG